MILRSIKVASVLEHSTTQTFNNNFEVSTMFTYITNRRSLILKIMHIGTVHLSISFQ